MFSHVRQYLQESDSFLGMLLTAECPVQGNVDKQENTIEMAEHSPHACTCRISTRLHVLHMRIWETLYNKRLYPVKSTS
jgi:hypothetical protein